MPEKDSKFKNVGYISTDGINFEQVHNMELTFDVKDPDTIFFNWLLGTKTTDIDRVIFNDPATIVFWKDKTKTVVKCHPEDNFDEEIGFMCCYLKRILSSKEYTKFCGYLNDIWEQKNDRLYREALEKKMAEKVEDKKHECGCGRSYHIDIINPIVNL